MQFVALLVTDQFFGSPVKCSLFPGGLGQRIHELTCSAEVNSLKSYHSKRKLLPLLLAGGTIAKILLITPGSICLHTVVGI